MGRCPARRVAGGGGPVGRRCRVGLLRRPPGRARCRRRGRAVHPPGPSRPPRSRGAGPRGRRLPPAPRALAAVGRARAHRSDRRALRPLGVARVLGPVRRLAAHRLLLSPGGAGAAPDRPPPHRHRPEAQRDRAVPPRRARPRRPRPGRHRPRPRPSRPPHARRRSLADRTRPRRGPGRRPVGPAALGPRVGPAGQPGGPSRDPPHLHRSGLRRLRPHPLPLLGVRGRRLPPHLVCGRPPARDPRGPPAPRPRRHPDPAWPRSTGARSGPASLARR